MAVSPPTASQWRAARWATATGRSRTCLLYTSEQDRFDDIDPIAIREALEERGIVNGQVADPEKLDNDPFIQQVMSDAEQIAAAETEQTSEVSISDEEYDLSLIHI